MVHYTTAHNAAGQGVVRTDPSTQPVRIAVGDAKIEERALDILYTSDRFPVDTYGDIDIQGQHIQGSVDAIKNGQICSPSGTSVFITEFGPNEKFPMHQTPTLDILVMLKGVLEMRLESGQVCELRTGDSVVQRGTAHEWRNITPEGGIVRFVAFVQPLAQSSATREDQS